MTGKDRNDVIFGVHAVTAALRYQSTDVQELWVASNSNRQRLKELLDLASAAALPVRRLPQERLDGRSGGARHQGVLALMSTAPPTVMSEAELDTLLQGEEGHASLFLVLDGVQDPHNLGACLRSADAVGVSGVILPKDRAVGITPVVRKVACGAAESVPLIQVTNLARTLRRLKDAGLWIIGADAEGTTSLYEADLSGPLALVLGAEGKGLRRLTREHCDVLVTIPMSGTVASLNVSVAAGVCLFEAVRRRIASPG